MITIFSTHKNFEGIFNTIQINALSSWRALSTEIEIIIFGDSKGGKEAANEINAKYSITMLEDNVGMSQMPEEWIENIPLPDIPNFDPEWNEKYFKSI